MLKIPLCLPILDNYFITSSKLFLTSNFTFGKKKSFSTEENQP
jgi:hypothetical protein